MLGGDYTWFDPHNLSEVGLAASLDIYDPVYDLTTRPAPFPLPDFGSETDESTRTAGLFAQDGITLTEQLKLVAGVRWSHYRQSTEDTNTVLVGKRIRNIPRHSLMVRSDYEFRSGPLGGLTLGGSATYTGDRSGDLEDIFELPSYWRIDVQAAYALTDNVKLGASVENLTNERYYTHAFSLFEVRARCPANLAHLAEHAVLMTAATP